MPGAGSSTKLHAAIIRALMSGMNHPRRLAGGFSKICAQTRVSRAAAAAVTPLMPPRSRIAPKNAPARAQ